MLVFWKERLVFFAVPKTVTTALEGALAPRAAVVMRDPPILKHTPVYRYHRFVLPLLEKAGPVDGLETLAVVRNPVDWLGSWYRYRAREDLAGHPNSTRGLSFDDFATEYTKAKPAAFAKVGSQAKFLQTPDKDMGVTHLFRYEAMPKVIGFLEDRLGTKITLPRVNVSPAMDLPLSSRVRDLLHEKCAREFAAWDMAQG